MWNALTMRGHEDARRKFFKYDPQRSASRKNARREAASS